MSHAKVRLLVLLVFNFIISWKKVNVLAVKSIKIVFNALAEVNAQNVNQICLLSKEFA